MSDEERDNDIESDADKRAHHNALERKRRDHIKDSFSSLRAVLSLYQNDNKVRASRAQILKRAADHIQCMRRKNSAAQQDIDDLKSQNKSLEEQIRQLEKAQKTGNFAAAAVIMESTHISNQRPNTVMYDGDSDSEASSVDSDSNPHLDESNEDITQMDESPRKRLRMN